MSLAQARDQRALVNTATNTILKQNVISWPAKRLLVSKSSNYCCYCYYSTNYYITRNTVAQLVTKCPLLWSLKVQYHFHQSLPLVSIQSQTSPIHTLISNFFKIHFNIVLLSRPQSTKQSNQNTPLISSSLTWPDHPRNIQRLQSLSLCSFLQPLTITSLLGKMFSSAPGSKTLFPRCDIPSFHAHTKR
jgi:hypothetical protein